MSYNCYILQCDKFPYKCYDRQDKVYYITAICQDKQRHHGSSVTGIDKDAIHFILVAIPSHLVIIY